MRKKAPEGGKYDDAYGPRRSDLVKLRQRRWGNAELTSPPHLRPSCASYPGSLLPIVS